MAAFAPHGAGYARRHGTRRERKGGAEALTEKFQKRAARIPAAARKALDKAAQDYWGFCIAALQAGGVGGAVYDKPVSKSKSGRPLWDRTDDLLAKEMAPEEEAPYVRKIVNEARYGIVRHRMPESLHDQGKKWGTKGHPRYGARARGAPDDRTDHWRLIAEEKFKKAGGLVGPVQVQIQHLFQTT